jgi:hypothetical protein
MANLDRLDVDLEDDGPPVVARLLQERLGLLEIRLLEAGRARLRLQRRAAHQEGAAERPCVLGRRPDRLQDRRLVDHVQQRLARLGIVPLGVEGAAAGDWPARPRR